MISLRSAILLGILSLLLGGCSASGGTDGPVDAQVSASPPTQSAANGTPPTETAASEPSPETVATEPSTPSPAVQNPDKALIRKNQAESFVHLEWKPNEPDVALPLQFGKDNTELVMGLDHPNGTKLLVSFPEASFAWQLDLDIGDELSAFYDYGDLKDDYTLQAAQYDFDGDGVGELIIAAGDGLTDLTTWVFSYTHVDDVTKVNPFRRELVAFGQTYLLLNENELMLPYGSSGLFDSYKYVDKTFMGPAN